MLGLVVLWAASSATFAYFATVYLPLKDEPFLHNYWHWISGVPTGRSLSRGLSGPLWPRVLPALTHTLVLLGYTMVIVFTFAILVGCVAGYYRGSRIDAALRIVSHLTWAVPPFILALVLEQFLASDSGGSSLQLFPPGGWAGQCPGGLGIDLHTFRCPSAGHGAAYVTHVLWYLTLPAVSLAAGFVGLHGRYLRSAIVQSLAAQYATTARAKGLSETRIVTRHALRNALILFAPAVLTDFGAIFGASLVIDLVFSLNGIGSLFFRVLNTGGTAPVIDAYAAQLLLLIGGAGVLAASFVSELLVGFLDPRVGFE